MLISNFQTIWRHCTQDQLYINESISELKATGIKIATIKCNYKLLNILSSSDVLFM